MTGDQIRGLSKDQFRDLFAELGEELQDDRKPPPAAARGGNVAGRRGHVHVDTVEDTDEEMSLGDI